MTPGAARAVAGAPVDPDARTARRWVTEELTDEAYAAAEPGLLTRFLTWLLESLENLDLEGTPGVGLSVLLAVVALVLVLGLRTAGTWRRAARSASAPVLGSTVTTADAHRGLARAAEQEQRWDDAVREWFRAVVRGCEERTLLTERPGRTADEAAREAAVTLPGVAADLAAGARRFDEVTYGSRRATAEHAEQLRRLDAAVVAARPRLADGRLADGRLDDGRLDGSEPAPAAHGG